jgi:hypothetical protein
VHNPLSSFPQVHMPQATVSEACHFSAHLRLPTTVQRAAREAFVSLVRRQVCFNDGCTPIACYQYHTEPLADCVTA